MEEADEGGNPSMFKRFLAILAILILLPLPALSSSPVLLSNPDYLQTTLKEIQKAKDSIYIVMYLVEAEDGPLKLIKALKRSSADVTLVMEEKGSNKSAAELLQETASVHFGAPAQFIHTKAIVIDKKTSILGSHNWTAKALTSNHEVSVLIEDPVFAARLLRSFKSIQRTEALKLGRRGAALPCSLFTGKDSPLSKLYTKNSEKAFDAYLLSALSRNDTAKDSDYIEIPRAYWDCGFNKDLSFKAKYFYLINLRERKKSKLFPWWQKSIKELVKTYGISKRSLTAASIELQRKDIIEVYRAAPQKREFFGFRPPNRYLLKELRSKRDFEEEIKRLKDNYGKQSLEEALHFADELNEPNDLAVIETFIGLIKKYGCKKVAEANKETAKLRPHNAKRHIGYTIHILERLY